MSIHERFKQKLSKKFSDPEGKKLGPHVQRLVWFCTWTLAYAQDPERGVCKTDFRCIKVCMLTDPIMFLLYIPINMELSAHELVQTPS